MLFSEIYSAYFGTVAKILQEAIASPISEAEVCKIINEKAFLESSFNIPQAISTKWHLLDGKNHSIVQYTPTMPFSTLQKRWLKTLLLDKRIELFDVDDRGLEEVEPLFTPQDIYAFDAYSDGDDFASAKYKRCFRTCLKALREKCWMEIGFIGARGVYHKWYVLPVHMEYSEKDDKFRLEAVHKGQYSSINIARMEQCKVLQPATPVEKEQAQDVIYMGRGRKSLVLHILDERNALERVLLHFSHLAKECERLDDNNYKLTLWYGSEEETEMVIRVLSFGPLVKVLEPIGFVDLIKDRLRKQSSFLQET